MAGASTPERERAETASALLRVLVDQLPAMLAYWDEGQRCRFANRAYEKWFGIAPEWLLGRHISELLGPIYPLNLPFIEAALRGEEQTFEREIPDPSGGPPRYSQAHYIPDVVDGVVRGFGVLVVDITERRRAELTLLQMERQLQASERLAAMATLAAGIAHEINNPLASVLGNLEVALRNLDRGDEDPSALRDRLAEARDGASRVSTIVQSMKLLARGDTTRELVDVDKVLDQSVGFSSNVIRYRAHLVRELGDVGFVEGNASQLSQVFVNLLANAAQALPEENVERNEIRISSSREGDDIVVEVADNGSGIPEELQSRIFEPFFTTKDVGGGMGLGLSISSGIVQGFGGTIGVQSKVGEGSIFRVVLPAATRARVHPSPAAAPVEEKPPRRARAAAEPGAKPRVLLIDDDDSVSGVLELVLAEDYDVTVVDRGRDAIAVLCEARRDFDVILCDLMMPEIPGPDVYAEVTKHRPELASRFVFMTGGAFTPRGREFLASVRAPVLDKPFSFDRVREVVRETAERSTGGA